MNQTISYYDKHAEEYCASTVNADMSFCREAFLSCLKKGAHILDCGCGSGRDITEDVREDRQGEKWVNALAWCPDMKALEIDGTKVKIYRHGQGPSFYIGMSEREYDSADTLVELLEKDHDLEEYNLIMYQVSDWNAKFSPWPAKAAFGDEDFTGEGEETLHWLTDKCIPKLLTDGLIFGDVPIYTAGYSLSGLFALWACMESDKFDGAVCCSGSLWIDGWMDYLNAKDISHDMNIYLSLGSKEERSKNPMLSKVGNCTRETYECLKKNPHVKNVTLQWNKGGHFADANKRLASGMKWINKLFFG